MKIAVIGAGAIGCLVAGYLKLKNEDVILLGHSDSVKAIKENGLQISGVRGNLSLKIDVSDKLSNKPDLVILSTKTQDIERALKDNFEFIRGTTVLTTQNGVQADTIVAKYVSKENIISSIVMFGATYLPPQPMHGCGGLEPAKVVHNFEGSWIIGRIFTPLEIKNGHDNFKSKTSPCPNIKDNLRSPKGDLSLTGFDKNDEKVIEISGLLNKIFPTIVSGDLKGMKILKIFVNANNCIPAILGVSMQEAFQDSRISQISIAIWKEGLDIVRKSGIDLVSLPDFPLERLLKLTSMPTDEAAEIFSGIMANLSREPLYGSILQSIKRGRSSEIDYINGEFLLLAVKNKLSAPLNEKLVEMVHKVEQTHRFFSKEELLNSTKGLCN